MKNVYQLIKEFVIGNIYYKKLHSSRNRLLDTGTIPWRLPHKSVFLSFHGSLYSNSSPNASRTLSRSKVEICTVFRRENYLLIVEYLFNIISFFVLAIIQRNLDLNLISKFVKNLSTASYVDFAIVEYNNIIYPFGKFYRSLVNFQESRSYSPICKLNSTVSFIVA